MCVFAVRIDGVVLLKTITFEIYHIQTTPRVCVSAGAYMVSTAVVPTVV